MESPPPVVFHDKAKRTQQGYLLRKSASHFAHCNEKSFEVALWKQTILQTKEMDLKNIAEGTTDPRVDFVSCSCWLQL